MIDLGALRANFAEAQRLAGGRRVIAVVKADGYGHGGVAVSRALVAAGCEQLAVVAVEEACELRDAGIALPILVLGGVMEDPGLAVARGLTPVIHHRGHLEALARAAKERDTRCTVHVEVDSGMSRMGVPADEAPALLADVAAEPALDLEGVYTHFAWADESDLAPSLAQLASFREVLAQLRARGIAPRLVHCANSAGLVAGKPFFEAVPETNAVRPGLMLYGVQPSDHSDAALRPVMTLQTRVVHVREVEPGVAVGYAALWRAERRTRVATLPVGYADGLMIGASNRGEVLIAGRRHPMIGRVSMDFVGCDVGEADVAVGDEALLFGAGPDGGIPVEELARAAGTIPYEVLVRVGLRVPRVILEQGGRP
ncbi:MAG: alanine racemase [Myxococcota bacterium]